MELYNIIYALLAGILPTLLWLYFWLKEDNLHPEPKTLVAIAFIVGSLSVIVAIVLEKLALDLIANPFHRYVVWAGIEEIVKFLAFAIVALHSKYFDEPIDAMIYFITVALGFAALENALFILTPIDAHQYTQGIIAGNLRFIGATLVHVVSSASIGFMMALTFYKGHFVKVLALLFGIILATTLHASFNLAIINVTGTSTLKVLGLVWCAVVILIILFEEIKNVKPKTV